MVFRIKESPHYPDGVPREPRGRQKPKEGPTPRRNQKAGTIGIPLYLPNVPVGSGAGRTRNQEPSGGQIPRVRQPTARPTADRADREIVREAPIRTGEILQRTRIPGGSKELPVVTVPKVTVPKPPVLSGPSVATGGPINSNILPTINQKVKTMDLGSLLGSAITGVTQYQLAKLQQPQMAASLFGYDVEADVPFVDITKEKKRRRRRRRLATTTDIRDLAALQGVIGKGEAFKTWIATHPSY